MPALGHTWTFADQPRLYRIKCRYGLRLIARVDSVECLVFAAGEEPVAALAAE